MSVAGVEVRRLKHKAKVRDARERAQRLVDERVARDRELARGRELADGDLARLAERAFDAHLDPLHPCLVQRHERILGIVHHAHPNAALAHNVHLERGQHDELRLQRLLGRLGLRDHLVA